MSEEIAKDGYDSVTQVFAFEVTIKSHGIVERVYIDAQDGANAIERLHTVGEMLQRENFPTEVAARKLCTVQEELGECPLYSDACCKSDEELYCGELTRIGKERRSGE